MIKKLIFLCFVAFHAAAYSDTGTNHSTWIFWIISTPHCGFSQRRGSNFNGMRIYCANQLLLSVQLKNLPSAIETLILT